MMRKKIFLLEDDEAIRDIIVMLLMDENYEVYEFASVTAFMKGELRPNADLFLLDIMLPDGSGIEVCTLLKGDRNTKNVPVLMMSAHSNENEVDGLCKAQGFLAKPFDIYDFMSKVNRTVNV